MPLSGILHDRPDPFRICSVPTSGELVSKVYNLKNVILGNKAELGWEREVSEELRRLNSDWRCGSIYGTTLWGWRGAAEQQGLR